MGLFLLPSLLSPPTLSLSYLNYGWGGGGSWGGAPEPGFGFLNKKLEKQFLCLKCLEPLPVLWLRVAGILLSQV